MSIVWTDPFPDWMAHPLAIGDAAFVEGIRQRYEATCAQLKREDTVLRPARRHHPPEVVWNQVLAVCGADATLLRERKRGGVQLGLMAWALQKHAGLTQREVADWLRLRSGAAVSLLLRRFQHPDPTLAVTVQDWQQQVNLLFKG